MSEMKLYSYTERRLISSVTLFSSVKGNLDATDSYGALDDGSLDAVYDVNTYPSEPNDNYPYSV
jgi:hypothetical protein